MKVCLFLLFSIKINFKYIKYIKDLVVKFELMKFLEESIGSVFYNLGIKIGFYLFNIYG